MTKSIKIYGERNTNTNYISKLISLNLAVKQLQGTVPEPLSTLLGTFPGNEFIRDMYFNITYKKNLGWKHACVKPMEQLSKYRIIELPVNFITITKNPYSWLMSLYRNPYHQYYDDKMEFEEFLKMPWKTVGRDNVRNKLISPIELWNIKNNSYLQLSADKTLNITTESIFKDPEEIIERISQKFSIPRLQGKFTNYENSTKDRNKDSNYYRNYYLNEQWRDKLSLEAVAIINETIDQKLMSHFGYDILSTS